MHPVVTVSMAFREHAKSEALADDLDGPANFLSAALAIDDDMTAMLERVANQGDLHQLFLAHEPDGTRHVGGDGKDVKEALMVADQNVGAYVSDPVQPLDLNPDAADIDQGTCPEGRQLRKRAQLSKPCEDYCRDRE